MSAKHTPGPWRTLAKNPRKIVTTGTRHTIVASCYTNASKGPGLRTKQSAGSPPRDEAEANARLIAAAPELLEALREFVEEQCEQRPSEYSHALGLARVVIAKATGEGEA